MTMKSLPVVAAVISFSFFIYLTSAGAVESLTIEAVRGKQVLDDADFKTIDDFVAGAVGEMLATEDFSSISRDPYNMILRLIYDVCLSM